ncbi:hypothetical protein IAU60_000779 [Kwoniella sp. DSM 27419]
MLSQGEGKGFEAWVEEAVSRKRLNEYEVEHHAAAGEDPAYAECFLETVEKPFRITVKKLPALRIHSDWECHCYVDGNSLDYPVWHKAHKSIDWDFIQEERAGRLHKSALKQMTTDDPDLVTLHLDADTLETIGVIEITLRRGGYSADGRKRKPVTSVETGIVHEKTKKFLYTIAGGDSHVDRVETTDYWTFRPYGDGELFYRFVFKYRAGPVLEKLGVKEPAQFNGSECNKSTQKAHFEKAKTRSQAIRVSPEPVARRDPVYIDLTIDEPSFQEQARLRWLEGRVRELAEDNERIRAGGKGIVTAVDLTDVD